MENKQLLVRPGYTIAVLLIVIPMLDTLASVWPFDPGSEQWRFAAVGALSTVGLTPILGIFGAFIIAVLFEHRTMLRLIGWGSAILAGLITIVMLGFLLDYLQARAGVAAAWRPSMDSASIMALVKQAGMLLACAWIGLAGIRSSRGIKKRKRFPTQPPPPLIS